MFSTQTSEVSGWWYAVAARPRHLARVDGAVVVVHRRGTARRRCATPPPTRRPPRAGAARPPPGSPARAEHPQGDLVGHGPRGHEERGLLAHPLGVRRLERVDRGVLAVAVVTHLGVGHGRPRRGTRRVASQAPPTADRHCNGTGPGARSTHAHHDRVASGSRIAACPWCDHSAHSAPWGSSCPPSHKESFWITSVLPEVVPHDRRPSWAVRDPGRPARWPNCAGRRGDRGRWTVGHRPLFWPLPLLECLTTLTVAATVTTRVTLGSCVLQLPLRSPAAVAKQAASLQLLSGGRFVLGVGVGSHPGEFAMAGADFARRGPAIDQGIAALRAAWASVGEPDLVYRQSPAVGAMPIWIGGSSAVARRRAALLGDGWVPLFLSPERYAQNLAKLREGDGRGRTGPGRCHCGRGRRGTRRPRGPGARGGLRVAVVVLRNPPQGVRPALDRRIGRPMRRAARRPLRQWSRPCDRHDRRRPRSGALRPAGRGLGSGWRIGRVRAQRPPIRAAKPTSAGRGRGVSTPTVSVVGTGMTDLSAGTGRRRRWPTRRRTRRSLMHGSTRADLSLVIAANALGGRLLDQGCLRGQSWFRNLGLGDVGVINVENSCAGGSSALHLGGAKRTGRGPPGARDRGREDVDRRPRRPRSWASRTDCPPTTAPSFTGATTGSDNPGGSVLMALNDAWARQFMLERGGTLEQFVATAVKARAHVRRNRRAQYQQPVTTEDVLASKKVAGVLHPAHVQLVHRRRGRRGARRARGQGPGRNVSHRGLACALGERLGRLPRPPEQSRRGCRGSPSGSDPTRSTWSSSTTPQCPEELFSLESLGFFEAGEAGPATLAGRHDDRWSEDRS